MSELWGSVPRLSGSAGLDGRGPDLIEPLVGFRQWSLRGDRLYSPHREGGVGRHHDAREL